MIQVTCLLELALTPAQESAIAPAARRPSEVLSFGQSNLTPARTGCMGRLESLWLNFRSKSLSSNWRDGDGIGERTVPHGSRSAG